MLKTIEQLKDKKIKLENKVNDVKSKIDGIQNRAKERKSVEQKQRDQEREFLTFQEEHLTKFHTTIAEKIKKA